MATPYLLGIDVGSYSTKGVLTTPEGEVLHQHVVEHVLEFPRPGWVEQDADAIWWSDTVAVCRSVIDAGFDPARIGAVAVSAIGPCMLPVDEHGTPLRPGVLYGIDTRAQAEIEWLNAELGEDAIFALGGMALTSQAIGPKILWLKRNQPEIYARTHKILTSSGYMIHKLTGEYVIDRHTASHYTPLVDMTTIDWDDRFAFHIIDIDKLPRMMWSTEIAGTITETAARETGLVAGTPVTAGTVDAAAEAVSVGAVQPGDLMVMYGTSMFFILVTESAVPDPRFWSTGFVFPGSRDVAGGMSSSGALTRWFRDQLCQPELAAEAAGGPNAYAALAALAAEIPAGADGLVCLPYFAGERTPINDPDARGVFAGLTLSHTRAHMYRSVLEGSAFGVRHNIETMQAMGASPQRIVAVGGGAKNDLWLQIVSDVARIPQVVPQQTIGAAYGDAFLAGLASGVIADRSVLAESWTPTRTIITPQEEDSAAYDATYAVYRSLFEHARTDLHTLAALAIAAGSDVADPKISIAPQRERSCRTPCEPATGRMDVTCSRSGYYRYRTCRFLQSPSGGNLGATGGHCHDR